MTLIRLRPVTENVDQVNLVSRELRAYLEAHGVPCRTETINGRDVLYACTVPDCRRPDFLFNAHIDVVPAASPDQFEPVLSDDGTLEGRGAGDCLGCAVAIADALIARTGKPGASCGAVFSADEETGGETTDGMIRLGYGAKKAVVIVDADYAAVTIAQKGIVSVRLTQHSKTGGGHSSQPWNFENPIDTMIDSYRKLRDAWKNPVETDQWHDSMAATVLSAGTVVNQIPDTASMCVNFRFTEPDGEQKIMELLRRCGDWEIEHPVFRKIRDIMSRRLGGREIPFVRLNGATDARFFIKLGVPVAILGVDGAGIHGKHETLKVDSLDVITSVLTELAGEPADD